MHRSLFLNNLNYFDYLSMTQLVTSIPESDLSRTVESQLDGNIKGRVLASGKTLCAPHAEAGTTCPF